jgi:hypothetical protein
MNLSMSTNQIHNIAVVACVAWNVRDSKKGNPTNRGVVLGELWYCVFLLLICWKLKPVFCWFWHCSFISRSPQVNLPQGNSTQQTWPNPTIAAINCKMVCWMSSLPIYAEPAKLKLSRSATINMDNQNFWDAKSARYYATPCKYLP